MTLVSCRAILLRSHPYPESSRILRFFTPDHGIVAVIARGARKRSSKGEGPIETFGEGTLTFSHRPDRDLHNLRDFERLGRAPLALAREVRRFVGASLLAEILLAHTLEEGDPDLYGWVSGTLARLGECPSEEVSGWILAGVWKSLALLGFPPGLERCVECEAELSSQEMCRFDVGAGGLRCESCALSPGMRRIGPGARVHLQALVQGSPPHPLPGARAHAGLLEAFTLHHLSPAKAFRGFSMLHPLLPGEAITPAESEDPSER